MTLVTTIWIIATAISAVLLAAFAVLFRKDVKQASEPSRWRASWSFYLLQGINAAFGRL